MRAKFRVVLASKFAQFDDQDRELSAQIQAISEEIHRQADAVREMELELAERTQRGYAIESEIRGNSGRLADIKLEADRNQAQRRHNDERCNELTIRASASESELGQARMRLAALEEELNSNRELLDSAAADVKAAQLEFETAQQQALLTTTALGDLEQQQEQSRIAILESVSAVSSLRNQLTQAEERMAGAAREAQRLETEMSAANAQAETFGGERGQLAIEFESVSQKVAALTDEIAQTRESLALKRRQEGEGKNHLDSLRAEFASALGKKSSLEAVIAEHGYSTESVRRLFQSGSMQGGHAPVGVLADFLEVEPRYEAVVEDFLRDELNYIVVKSWDAADEGLRILRNDVDGRATFLVHPEDSQARFSFAVPDGNPGPPNDSILPLKHTIRVLDGFGKSLEVILPKLRDGYIVADPRFARDLALENPDAFCLSQSGECFHNVTVTGGKQRAEGPLSMKRELRDVTRLLGELEQALRHQETRVLNLGHEIKDLTSLLERLETEKRESEKQAMTSGHALRQMDSEMARVRERCDICERELARLTDERVAQENIVTVRQTEVGVIETRRAELEQAAASAHDQLASLSEQRDLAAQTVSERKAQVATLAERHRSAASVLDRIAQLVAEMQARVNSLLSQIESATTEKTQRELENQAIAGTLADCEAERNACEVRAGLLQFESEQARARLTELDTLLREARRALDASRDRKAELSTTAVKLQSDAEYLAQTCIHDLSVQRAELMADSTLPRVLGEELGIEEQACQEMRARLEAMGPVNMMALEEYKEAADRHAF